MVKHLGLADKELQAEFRKYYGNTKTQEDKDYLKRLAAEIARRLGL